MTHGAPYAADYFSWGKAKRKELTKTGLVRLIDSLWLCQTSGLISLPTSYANYWTRDSKTRLVPQPKQLNSHNNDTQNLKPFRKGGTSECIGEIMTECQHSEGYKGLGRAVQYNGTIEINDDAYNIVSWDLNLHSSKVLHTLCLRILSRSYNTKISWTVYDKVFFDILTVMMQAIHRRRPRPAGRAGLAPDDDRTLLSYRLRLDFGTGYSWSGM